MPPCHAKPFIDPATAATSASSTLAYGNASDDAAAAIESCDYCRSPRLEWRKCKLVCADCRQINKSCADL
ncbi:MAG: hypothetical protein ACHQWU_16550 [Gemmatimonadales bacterium]|jgi:hypothetical protein